MSNAIFIAVFIVCTVTKDVILVNKIKYKTERVGREARARQNGSHDHHKRNISLLLLEPFQCVTIIPT